MKESKIEKYEGLALERIEEVLEEFLDELCKTKVETKRTFKIRTGCKTNGWTDLEIENLCSDPKCTSCSSFRRALQEEINKQL